MHSFYSVKMLQFKMLLYNYYFLLFYYVKAFFADLHRELVFFFISIRYNIINEKILLK